MNTLVREGKVIRKIYSKKESYSLVPYLNYKGRITKSQSRTEYLQGLCNGRLITMKQNNNERNEKKLSASYEYHGR